MNSRQTNLFCNLILGIVITTLFICIMEHQTPFMIKCKHKENGYCNNEYHYIKYLDEYTTNITDELHVARKDLQNNYCVLGKAIKDLESAKKLINCNNKFNESSINITAFKIKYAINLLFLWFAIRSITLNNITFGSKLLIRKQENIIRSITLNNFYFNSVLLVRTLLIILAVLCFGFVIKSLLIYNEICDCFSRIYATDMSRVGAGILGLFAMAICNKIKNYEILVVLYCVYGVGMFGM